MKTKPVIGKFKSKIDPSEFLEGGRADKAEKKEQKKEVAPKVYREQKFFRLRSDLVEALKNSAFERSRESGSRVTETEIVEEALQSMLYR
jgi:transposase-like protein